MEIGIHSYEGNTFQKDCLHLWHYISMILKVSNLKPILLLFDHKLGIGFVIEET